MMETMAISELKESSNAKELENGKSPLNYVKLMINENYEEHSRKEKRLEEVQRLIREKETL